MCALAGTGLGFGPTAGSPVMMKSLGMVLVGAAAMREGNVVSRWRRGLRIVSPRFRRTFLQMRKQKPI
jgi:hypothetical protein